jgi:hypothetical protein
MSRIFILSTLAVGFIGSFVWAFAGAPDPTARRARTDVESVAALVPECHDDTFLDANGRIIGTVPHCQGVPVAEARNQEL